MEIVYAALCCASITFTISVTSIFKGIRELISRIHPKLEELIHCPWCLGHYITLFYLVFVPETVLSLSESKLVNVLVTWFAIIGLMGLIHYVLLRAYDPVKKAMMQREMDKLNETDSKEPEDS